MLTNKNTNFVRSIAMLLAMLMVLALCLTGCGNKTADEALTKAEEAKTVADEVKAALADYLKTADAETKVAELVDAALADGAATAEELDALAAKLENYVTTDKVAELIKNEVAAAAIAGAMTKDEIMEILKNYYTKEEIDDKLEAYFGEFEPAEVYKMMQDVDKAMNENDWNAASEVVIDTIAAMQDLIEAVDNELYTQANMKAVNEKLAPLGVAPFVADVENKNNNLDADGKPITTDLVPADVYGQDFQKMLEYTILRVASVEAMEELKAAVEAAVAVPTYESEFEALIADLYAMGALVATGSYPDADNEKKFEADEWTKAGKYHGVDYAKGAEVLTQVVTLNDKAAFYAWGRDYHDLLTTYAADLTASTSALVSAYTVNNVFVKTSLNAAGKPVTQIDLDTKETMSGWTKVGQTILDETVTAQFDYAKFLYAPLALDKAELNDTKVFALPTDIFSYVVSTKEVETDWKNTGKYGYKGAEKVFTDLGMTPVIDDKGTADTKDDVNLEYFNAYGSIVAQLNECQTAANTANTKFESFLKDVVYGKSEKLILEKPNYDLVTDADLLAALTKEMCEPCGYPYSIFLKDVTTYMWRSRIVNGMTTTGILRYDLYADMVAKSYDLLWEKYQTLAYEMADKILADYTSIVYAANDKSYDNKTTVVAPALANVVAAMQADNRAVEAANLTADFLAKYYAGNADFADGSMYDELGLTFKNNGLINFYANNGTAVYVKTSTGYTIGQTVVTYAPYVANPLKTIRENADDIALRLTGAMIDIDLKIAAADKEAAKAAGVPVQEAFYDILNEGIANLEEVYDRFLLEDYKAMTMNDMVAKAQEIINFYYVASDDGITQTVLKDAMDQYLMGVRTRTLDNDVATNKGTAYAPKTNLTGLYYETADTTNNPSYGGAVNKDGNKKITSLVPGKNALNNVMGISLDNAQLVSNISGITVNKYDTTNAKNGAEANAKIDAYAAKATAKIENVVIKACFEEYLHAAHNNWFTLRVAYSGPNGVINQDANQTSKLLENKLALQYNIQLLNSEVEDTITVVTYNDKRGEAGIALDDYKATYIELLQLIADVNNQHVALLSGESIEKILNATERAKLITEVVEDALELIESSLKLPTNEDGTPATWVADMAPLTPYNNLDADTTNDYVYIGTAAVKLDQLINANATYLQDDVEVTLY